MKKILIAICIVLGLTASAQEKVNEVRTVNENFTSISASDGVELVLTQADAVSVHAGAAQQKYLEHLKTVVENGVLKIYYDDKNWAKGSGRKLLKVEVSLPKLTKLVINDGSTAINTNQFDADDIQIQCNDGSTVKLKNFNANTLSALVKDGSTMLLKGKTTKLNVEVKDGSSFNGDEFVTEVCDANANDGSSVKLNVTKELTATAHDGSSIQYEGSPAIKKTTAKDGSSIKKS
ncbi:MAG: DUF2807 domain-containing protein [Chitinophagaceae bacterium]|nr:DUF2807 domain-containing protein [Chitinophagaceae bacterium]